MMKRLTAALAAAMMLATVSANAAGTIPLAMAQQVDVNGAPLAGCLLSFYVAGTPASPQNAFSDFGLTQALPNPMSCDQTGRIPMFWLADGLIHVRLTDSTGLQIIDTTMQVLGPSSGGGGGGGTVDPTTILATGDLKVKYGTGPLAGFVRANGLTIGNGTCGCSERANSDAQSLFVYLYNADPNLAVSGGRTGNALNDFNSSKQLTLPDWRGRALAALDDMGNSAAGRLTATYFGTSATVLGAAGGNQNHTQTIGEMPAHSHANTLTDPGHTHTGGGLGVPSFSGQPVSVGSGAAGQGVNGITTLSTNTTGVTINNVSAGGGAAFPTVPPMMLATVYVKL
jgi:hypothetical protein